MFTLKLLQEKLAAGKIRGYEIPVVPLVPNQKQPVGKVIGKYFKKRSKEKDWISWNLWIWCSERNVKLYEEFRFDDIKKYRADWAVDPHEGEEPGPHKRLCILVEYEGLFSEKSGHTTAKGYTKDTEKYTLAMKNGFRVLRYTALNYRNLLKDLNDIAHAV